MGITSMTKEHIALCLLLKIPFFVLLTKVDICPENILSETIENLKKILKLPGIRKVPYLINSDEDIILSSKNMLSENIVPILQISNVTGFNIDKLKKFLAYIPKRINYEKY